MNSEAKVIGKGRCDTDVQVLNMQRMAMVFNTTWGGHTQCTTTSTTTQTLSQCHLAMQH